MPKIQYQEFKFRSETIELITLINAIVEDYHRQGFDLTLRQVYYQLVARGYIPNNEKSYKRVGNIVNDGRLAGLIDWEAITDRTRYIRRNSHWESPRDIIQSAMHSYQVDHWENQANYVEVWVEKDALVGVVGSVCSKLDVPYFSCRGYVSQSEMWGAARRLKTREYSQYTHIIHLGDHDPSGIDMTRDIKDRLELFGSNVQVHRIALTMEQVEQFNPPPNPTKLSDARAQGYLDAYGEECWELDALDPKTIKKLIENKVTEYLDTDIQSLILKREKREKAELKMLHDRYSDIIGDYQDSIYDYLDEED